LGKIIFLEDKKLKEKFYNSISKALLLTSVSISDTKTRIFAISFGYGRTLLKQDVCEERFGIITALNIIDKDTIRSIDKIDIGRDLKSSTESMPKLASMDQFGFDHESELLNKITGKSIENFIEGNVSGKDAFTASIEANISNIDDVLKDLYQYFLSDKYKDHFDWIDQITPIKNKDLIKKLDTEMLNLILNRDPTFWAAVPENINWEDIKGF